MIEKRFWKPEITSQFSICPVPFHLDTYRGCTYGCTYCFARDLIVFARRNQEHKSFSYLVGNDAIGLERYLSNIYEKKEYDYSKASQVAVLERIPMKIGANADPFPIIETGERITFDILKVLEKYDYPVEIQTKNPGVLLEYIEEFKNPNWVIAVTIISIDEGFCKIVEPRAPSVSDRIEAIKKITSYGIPVIVKVQPFIYPKIIDDLPELVKAIKRSGAFAFNLEGLKCKVALNKQEQEIFQTIGDYFGYNMREFLKEESKKDGKGGMDYEFSKENKTKVLLLAKELADKNGIRFLNADNLMLEGIADSCECCGTEVLRNYKLFGEDKRSLVYGNTKPSEPLANCLYNFGRNKAKWAGLTMKESAKIKIKDME
jgi:DNA repair photolyase